LTVRDRSITVPGVDGVVDQVIREEYAMRMKVSVLQTPRLMVHHDGGMVWRSPVANLWESRPARKAQLHK